MMELERADNLTKASRRTVGVWIYVRFAVVFLSARGPKRETSPSSLISYVLARVVLGSLTTENRRGVSHWATQVLLGLSLDRWVPSDSL